MLALAATVLLVAAPPPPPGQKRVGIQVRPPLPHATPGHPPCQHCGQFINWFYGADGDCHGPGWEGQGPSGPGPLGFAPGSVRSRLWPAMGSLSSASSELAPGFLQQTCVCTTTTRGSLLTPARVSRWYLVPRFMQDGVVKTMRLSKHKQHLHSMSMHTYNAL